MTGVEKVERMPFFEREGMVLLPVDPGWAWVEGGATVWGASAVSLEDAWARGCARAGKKGALIAEAKRERGVLVGTQATRLLCEEWAAGGPRTECYVLGSMAVTETEHAAMTVLVDVPLVGVIGGDVPDATEAPDAPARRLVS